jgi:sugar phosphate isomerase/epimerase
VVHGFKLASFLGSEELEWEQTEAFLRFLGPYAKETGVTVCLENLYNSLGGHIVEGPCADPVKTAQRIDSINDELGEEVFGFCFATGHANLLGLDFEHFIVSMGNRLKLLHIHDNDAIADMHQIPFTFTRGRENQSITDWPGFIRGLREISYTGVLSFETSPVLQAFPPALWSEALGFIAKIGSYFSSELELSL